jgi:hypothetical protein
MSTTDQGAFPLEIALRAESGAHRASEKVDDLVEEQGKRNRSFADDIAQLQQDVAKIWGAVGLLKWLLPLAATVGFGLAGLVGKLVH